MAVPPPMTDKAILRRAMRERRAVFVAGLGEAGRQRLDARLRDLVLPRLPAEGIVSAYSAYGDEIDPRPLVGALPGRIALPWFAGRDTPMAFRLWDGGALEGGPFEIPQPPASALLVEPDVLLVPLVAADAFRNRLGQGKGHYDRALHSLSKTRPFHAIGLAWDMQIVDEVPRDGWDMPLDAVATPTRWIT